MQNTFYNIKEYLTTAIEELKSMNAFEVIAAYLGFTNEGFIEFVDEILDIVDDTVVIETVLDKNNNRFMDDLYLFTKIEKSYILDSELFSKQKIDEIFKDIDTENGVRIIISEGLSQTEQIYEIMEVINKNSFTELKKMNACTIYLIE